jgi:hypothetical protein
MSWAQWIFPGWRILFRCRFDYNEALELAREQVMPVGEGECGEPKGGAPDGKEAKTHARRDIFFCAGRRIYLY